MPRVTINVPENFLFTCEIPVRINDINYGGHVGNDAILSIIHDARVQFYRSLGYKSELNFDGPIGHIIADAALVYKSESFIGDTMVVNIAIDDYNKYGFDMMYLLTNKATGKEIARGKTGIVFYDYDRKKIATIPQSFLDNVKGLG